MWLQHFDKNAAHRLLPDQKALYLQINQIRNSGSGNLRDLMTAVVEQVKSHSVEKLILDLRLNSGGNGVLNRHIVNGLIAATAQRPELRIYVLIGRRTFSAAMNLAADLERQLPVTFAGEATGTTPTHIGETNMVLLPNSGLRVSVATRLFVGSYSDDQRKWIPAQISYEPRFSDYRAGKDPLLKALLAL